MGVNSVSAANIFDSIVDQITIFDVITLLGLSITLAILLRRTIGRKDTTGAKKDMSMSSSLESQLYTTLRQDDEETNESSHHQSSDRAIRQNDELSATSQKQMRGSLGKAPFSVFDVTAIAAIFGACSTTFSKLSLTMMKDLLLSESDQYDFSLYVSWFVAIGFLILGPCVCGFVATYFNQVLALRHFDALLVIPLYAGTSSVIQAIFGVILFREFRYFGGYEDWLYLSLGVGFNVLGLICFTRL